MIRRIGEDPLGPVPVRPNQGLPKANFSFCFCYLSDNPVAWKILISTWTIRAFGLVHSLAHQTGLTRRRGTELVRFHYLRGE
jgi:hypothetical protein